MLASACKRADTPPPPPPDPTPTAETKPVEPQTAPPPPACEELELEACAEQGTLLLLSPTPADAIPLLTWACAMDHAEACANLATSYRAEHLPPPAQGVVHDLNVRGCSAGSARSCGLLGADYYEGEAVERDITKAAKLLAGACEQDERQACSLLGNILVTDHQDLSAAAKVFARGCELGDVDSCKNAGVIYLSKLGEVQLALGLFERACAERDAEACYNLGAVHGEGLYGAAQDLAAGEQWMRKACELGDKDGCAGADKLAAAQDPNAVVGANLNVGSMDVNGMTIMDLQCRLSGGGGLFGSMALAGTLAEKKKAFDKCAPKGAAPIVRWDFDGGKTHVLHVDDPSEQVAACVEKIMKKVPATMQAQCRATLLIGNKQGAEQAAASR
ncbi:hypothetical protein DB30_07649 [Enhygromyxa salina]|uniref:Uncharacterized protein n=1 Tax=Enhygromyxa salina TaxID=215803 RepID=A0A0C1ZMD1_9BACT|nr:hypothetical protein DB30_07649 [Enhygromyxa salina]